MEHINNKKWLPYLVMGIIVCFAFLHVITRNESVGIEGRQVYTFSSPSNAAEIDASKQIMNGKSGSIFEDLYFVYKELGQTIKTAIQTIKRSLFTWPMASAFSIS